MHFRSNILHQYKVLYLSIRISNYYLTTLITLYGRNYQFRPEVFFLCANCKIKPIITFGLNIFNVTEQFLIFWQKNLLDHFLVYKRERTVHLKLIGHLKSKRLFLPVRGQRTRTNARTCKKKNITQYLTFKLNLKKKK
jgi:hypothetical protein